MTEYYKLSFALSTESSLMFIPNGKKEFVFELDQIRTPPVVVVRCLLYFPVQKLDHTSRSQLKLGKTTISLTIFFHS